MANEITKTLNTRVLLKVDTLERWNASTLPLLKGELAIATVAATAGNALTEPVTMIKIGDGSSTFSELKWNLYAKASDVLEVAKDATKLTAFITSLIEAQVPETVRNTESLKTFIETVVSTADLDSNSDFQTLASKVNTLVGSGNGSVAEQINAAINALELSKNYVATKEGYSLISDADIAKLATIAEGATKVEASETNGYIKINGTDTKVYTHPEKHTVADISDFDSAIAAKGFALDSDLDALSEDVGSVDSLATTSKVVVSAINEVKQAVEDHKTAAALNITPSADGLTYTVTQGGNTVGTINIPADMVVESGAVAVNPEGQEAGTYIKLVLKNVKDPLYINVGHLVDIYTHKAGATQVQLNVDNTTREISATIVEESVTSKELAANSVITAKIADNNVTYDKLSTGVQASLDKAGTALQAADVGTMAKETAADYVKKTEAEGYGDILTKTAAATLYQPAGDYASKAQGEKADTAVQSVTSVENNGIKATRTGNDVVLDWDTAVTLIFDCGDSGVAQA